MVTPYHNFLPIPPLGIQRVWQHRDSCFSCSDWVCWPQPFTEAFCHFACIPCPTDTLPEILWWDVSPSDFVQETAWMTTTDAVGKLCSEQTAEFAFFVNDLEKRVQKFFRCHQNETEIQLACHLFTIVGQMLVQLESLTATFLQMQNVITSLQRYSLELLGLLDYCQLFKPMINGTARCPGFDNSRLGAYVYNNHC